MKKSKKVTPSRGLAGRCAPKKEPEFRHVFVNVYPSGNMGCAWDTIEEANARAMDGCRLFCGKITEVKSASPRSAKPAGRSRKKASPKSTPQASPKGRA